jgi:hypothetical protein
MGKRLPPMSRNVGPLIGPNLDSYTVGSWCPTPDGSGQPIAVAISFRVLLEPDGHMDCVVRLKSPMAVDQMIQCLLRHKRDVWPEAK